MGLTSQQKQAAYRERMAAKGIVPVSLEMPQKLIGKISAEAIAAGKTRSQLVIEKLKVKPKKPPALPAAPLPKDVHMLAEVDPQFGIHRLIKTMKGRSSRLLRQEFPWLRSRLPTLWTNSYFVVTVGGAPLAVIKQYIENQKGM